MKKIASILFLLLSINFYLFAQREQDSLALVALYQSTDGPNWVNKTNWLSSYPISSWTGVTVQNNRVTSLTIANNNLEGSLPAEMANLTKLITLSFYNNNLTSLVNLSGLTDLISINIGNNQLDFSDIETAQLDWSKPGFVYSPQNLFLPLIRNLSSTDSVFTVNYSYPGITFQWYNDGALLPGQTSISLTVPASSPGGFACQVNHTNFPSLQLSSESAGVLHGGVSFADSLALVAFYNATGGNNWTNKTNWLSTLPVSSWYGIKTSLGKVSQIELTNNNLTGPIPVEILFNFSNLANLNLQGNKLGGIIPFQIGNLSNLTNLNLSGNQLSGTIPTQIGNLSNLISLILSGNLLTGTIPAETLELTNLEGLILNGNKLSGSIPSEIGNLVNLYNLTLSNNQFNGSIPAELFNLTKLITLYISSNQLSGSIPSEIANLTNLAYLDLGINQLSGTIPPQIGNLVNLRSLNLSTNAN